MNRRPTALVMAQRAALALLLLLAALPGRAPAPGVAAAGAVALALSPMQTQAVKDQLLTLDLTVSAGGQSFDAADIALDFDPAILRVANADGGAADAVTPTPGLAALGVTVLRNRADNPAGRIDFSIGRMIGTAPLNGAFVAATLRFKALAPTPATPVQFSTQALRPTGVYFAGTPVTGALTSAQVGVAGVRMTLTPAVNALAVGQTATLTLIADTSHQAMDALDAYLDFDPARLRLVDSNGNAAATVAPATSLPAGLVVLRNQGDNALGRIAFSVGRDPQTAGAPLNAAIPLATIRLMALASGGGAGLRFSTKAPRATAAYLAGSVVTGPLQDAAIPVNGAGLRLTPSSATGAVNGAPVAVDLLVDAGAQRVDAVDVFLRFDPALARATDAAGADAGSIAADTAALGQVLRNQVDNGAGRVSFSIRRAPTAAAATGSFRIRTLRLQGRAAGTAAVTFSQRAPDLSERLGFSGQPIRAASGVAFGAAPRAAHVNGAGAIQTSDSATVVTLGIAAGMGPAGAALSCPGDLTRMTEAGVATFDGCSIDLPGEGYVLEATAAGLAAARTALFNVTLAGDVDAEPVGGVCRVSAIDYSLLVTHYGKTSADPGWLTAPGPAFPADLDGDGRIGVLDFSVLVSRFGTTATACTPPSEGNPAPPP
ncbi:MAG: hypothetical protein NTZ05_06250 [Chloroflexi bacterium]|nr:hypothetical protein [Chloroflexota bacterium]